MSDFEPCVSGKSGLNKEVVESAGKTAGECVTKVGAIMAMPDCGGCTHYGCA